MISSTKLREISLKNQKPIELLSKIEKHCIEDALLGYTETRILIAKDIDITVVYIVEEWLQQYGYKTEVEKDEKFNCIFLSIIW